jgi:hypothetical protein
LRQEVRGLRLTNQNVPASSLKPIASNLKPPEAQPLNLEPPKGILLNYSSDWPIILTE